MTGATRISHVKLKPVIPVTYPAYQQP